MNKLCGGVSRFQATPVIFLACKVFEGIVDSSNQVTVCFIDYGLHSVPRLLKKTLQQRIDNIQTTINKFRDKWNYAAASMMSNFTSELMADINKLFEAVFYQLPPQCNRHKSILLRTKIISCKQYIGKNRSNFLIL